MNVHPSFLAKRRKPRFKLPPGATDAHCHVFGPGDKFPYAPNRRYTPEDAPKEMLARAARPSRHRARGDRAGELPRHRQRGDARLHRVRPETLSRRRHRRRQLHRRRLRPARRRRRARRALQFRQASGRRARHGRVQPRHRPHQGPRLARGAASRRARHHAAVGHDPRSCRCRSSSTIWAACRRRPASISRRCAR